MSHSEDRHLDFVLRHYKEGAFDTEKAIGRFREAKGIKPQPRRRISFAAIAISVAAAVLLGVFLFTGLESRQWTDVAVADAQQTVVLPDGRANVGTRSLAHSYSNLPGSGGDSKGGDL